MKVVAVKNLNKKSNCKECCLYDLCGSALARSVETKFKLPDCKDGKFYFNVKNGTKDSLIKSLKNKMITLLQAELTTPAVICK